jgi:Flp pilus assembly pilin Flp
MTSRVLQLLRNDRGNDMIEYGLVCSLISIAAVLVLQALAPIVLGFWNEILAAIQTAG